MSFQFLAKDFQIGRRGRLALLSSAAVPAVKRVIIYDEDHDSDVDGVSGLAYALGELDELEQLYPGQYVLGAVIATSNMEHTAPSLKLMLRYAGRPNVPVGAYKGSGIGGHTSSAFTPGVTAAFALANEDTRAEFPDALTVYRQVLHDAPDGSVYIYVGGTATSLKQVMDSPGDAIDPRTGPHLLAAKVAKVRMCGGNFVTPQANESNIYFDVPAAQALATQTYMDVDWAGLEIGSQLYGSIPLWADSVVDPFKYAWKLGGQKVSGPDGQTNWRFAGDQVAFYATLYDQGSLFTFSERGDVAIASNSVTTFTPNPSGRNRYMVMDPARKADVQAYIQGKTEAFVLRHDVQGPTITSPTARSRAENTTTSTVITASEPFTATVQSGDGYTVTGGNTLNWPAKAVGVYSPVIRLTDSKGNYRDTVFTDTVTVATAENFLVAEWLLNEASGQTVVNAVDNNPAYNGFLGISSGNATNDPAKVAAGYDFATQQVITFTNQPAYQTQYLAAGVVFQVDAIPSAVSQYQTLIAKHNNPAQNTSWQLRLDGSELSVVGRGTTVTVRSTTGLGLQPGVWYHAAVWIQGTALRVYLNGVLVLDTTLAVMVPATVSPITLGARVASSPTEALDGRIAYAAFYGGQGMGSGLMTGVYNRAKAAAAVKGITV